MSCRISKFVLEELRDDDPISEFELLQMELFFELLLFTLPLLLDFPECPDLILKISQSPDLKENTSSLSRQLDELAFFTENSSLDLLFFEEEELTSQLGFRSLCGFPLSPPLHTRESKHPLL